MIEVLAVLFHVFMLFVLAISIYNIGRIHGHRDYLDAMGKYLDEARAMIQKRRVHRSPEHRLFDFLFGMDKREWYMPWTRVKVTVSDQSEEYVDLPNRVVADPVGQEKA
jgi:hypothetical protein